MRLAICAAIVCGMVCARASATVFVNEIDYNQPGTDTAEFIELAGTAGTNLNGWTLNLMNGANDTAYQTIALPSFTFSNETGTGWGFFVLGRPSVANSDYDLGGDDFVQNGPNDGVQLVNPTSSVEHYVEYAFNSSLSMLSGPDDVVPAAVTDDNTTTGLSIYKTGTGSSYGDFTWTAAADSITPGALNPGETLLPEPAAISLVVIPLLTMRRRR